MNIFNILFPNAHEPAYRQYDFSGNIDLIQFLKTIQDHGLYNEMKNFTTLIVNMPKKKLFASRGGNIILAQVYMINFYHKMWTENWTG
ncbi:hypothetical protein GOBAR_AA02811 [Gossypium barbadense]|uniref:Uncharacterized protein n=1 Tax=Gossypium barbadense TaxID=3634 RepID=A0A2P5YQF0_GOSBA|nr:hypothetical protein GOBAR_AA02811 [Gossypium barbadense]